MGLDMYLSKKTYVKNWAHQDVTEKHEITVTLGGKKHPYIKPEKVTYITEEAGYWRKANHIHVWFVANVQEGQDDCREYEVDLMNLQLLLDTCKSVMENRPSAELLLPTQSGFFFGGTAYDEYYFSDIEETIAILEEILKHKITTERGVYLPFEVYYQASW